MNGYKRINDYLCRNKNGGIITYNKIPGYYNLFKNKVKENDEKIALIVECIKSQLQTGKKTNVDNNVFWRGDDFVFDKNMQLETFCSVTTDKRMAQAFSSNIYKIIINNDVKRLFLNSQEKETLIENNCFYQIIDKNIIIVHSPNTLLNYPYRYIHYKNDIFEPKHIFKIARVIEYYCDIFFTNAIHEYIQMELFTKPKINNNHKYRFFTYKCFIMQLKDNVVHQNIDFLSEDDYDTFNELVKDIFIKRKTHYRETFNQTYMPIIRRLLSKSKTPRYQKSILRSMLHNRTKTRKTSPLLQNAP